jgi:DNA-binding transcriptional MocR family regulator
MSKPYADLTAGELEELVADLRSDVDALKAKGLKLDMARGKPSSEQVDLSRPMLDALTSSSDLLDEGVDAANYGAPDGLPSARKLMAEIIGVDPSNVVVAGSSSLNLMYDVVGHAYSFGIRGAEPWCRQEGVKFLCPSPGYDRHFGVTAHYGIENVPVPMKEDGPDMDVVEELVKDPKVKGIWCVPKYQNPTGVTFSDEVVRRFASLEPAAEDFRIYWDNAYVVHEIDYPGDELLEIFGAVADAGADDLVYEFASTSKVTFPGSGIACVAASAADMADLKRTFSMERVCSDKMTQLMHVRYFSSKRDVLDHMKKMAAVLKPRFDLVEEKLSRGLDGLGIATWTHPKGGYFVSFDGLFGTAKDIVALCKETGVVLTGAGATWPYGNDPEDTNIRIAPSYPALGELSDALDVFVACVKLVSAEKLLREARA